MEQVTETLTWHKRIVRRFNERLYDRCSLCIITCKESRLTSYELSKALSYAPSTFLVTLTLAVWEICHSSLTLLYTPVEHSLLSLGIGRFVVNDEMVNDRWLIEDLRSKHVSPRTHYTSLGNSLSLDRSVGSLTKISNDEVGRID